MPGVHRIVLIAKTDFGDGFCYLGWDMKKERILRLIPDRSDGKYYWPLEPNYDVGKAYEFTSKDIAQNFYPKTPEDIGVSGEMSIIEENPMPNMFAELQAIAKNSVEEIWPNIIEEGKFVRENDYLNHHSTGILKCKRANLYCYPDPGEHRVGERRIHINNKYDFPLQAIDPNLPVMPEDEDVLIVLELARPMPDRNDPSLPRRCYILATGILTERKLQNHIIVLIAKTDFSDGYCYLGWDMGENRIRRLIPDREDGFYFWPLEPDYDVGKAYEFTSKHIAKTLHPEDIVVSGEMSINEENPMPNMFAELQAIARDRVEDIWPNIIEERKFIRANHYLKHHSTGILKSECTNLDCYLVAGKRRILINNKNKKYDFPWKAMDPDLPVVPEGEDKDVLVVLGLARPMADKINPSLPGRCYILATGLLTSKSFRTIPKDIATG